MELPAFSTLKVRQNSRKLTKSLIDSLDHLIVVVPARPPGELFRQLPSGAYLRRVYEHSSAKGRCLATTRLDNAKATAVTLTTFSADDRFAALGWARKSVADAGARKARQIGFVTVGLKEAARERAAEACTAALAAASFALPQFKSRRTRAWAPTLTLFAAEPELDFAATLAAATGNNIARWFTAMPPNRLTVADYRDALKAIANDRGLGVEFYDEAKLGKLGAGAFLAVAQGNADRDAGIVRLKYRPSRAAKPSLALVGKGILFDTGGTNLKPFKGMLDMHTDMQGSAVALGTLVALAELEVPYAIDTWLALTENRTSGTAYKSQDVVTAANGTTIQVIHTDAEGRMVLADTLALAAEQGPDLVIDYATLTGTCVAALTDRYSGVFSNREAAGPILTAAGRASGERVWPFPMDEDFDEGLASDVADVRQCSPDGHGDHILAARFLNRFVPSSIPWVHVDLAAGSHKGGLAQIPTEITGFGVRFTLELLRGQSSSAADLAKKLSA